MRESRELRCTPGYIREVIVLGADAIVTHQFLSHIKQPEDQFAPYSKSQRANQPRNNHIRISRDHGHVSVKVDRYGASVWTRYMEIAVRTPKTAGVVLLYNDRASLIKMKQFHRRCEQVKMNPGLQYLLLFIHASPVIYGDTHDDSVMRDLFDDGKQYAAASGADMQFAEVPCPRGETGSEIFQLESKGASRPWKAIIRVKRRDRDPEHNNQLVNMNIAARVFRNFVRSLNI